jgi:2-polyprenyl-3-methyl-5-hydroxy-6-metoxy-1,4-benzoquinol methylase
MDNQTIDIYNQEAERIATLHSTLIPERIYELIFDYFVKNAKTADIGCGIGRDTAWLNHRGFSVIGADASSGMLDQARNKFPSLQFIQDTLPSLNTLKQHTFKNILCSAVLMHLSLTDVLLACHRLVSMLQPNGFLIISFRNTHEKNKRENGKLYEEIEPNHLITLFSSLNCTVELHESVVETGRNLTWHNLVIKKLPLLVE